MAVEIEASVTRDSAPRPRTSQITATHAVIPSEAQPLRGWAAYGFVIGATFLALGASLLLRGYLERAVFLLFWPAVLSAAIYAGLWPAVLASVISVAMVDYWLIPKSWPEVTSSTSDLGTFLMFVLASVLVSSMAHRGRLAESRAIAAARENATLAEQLEGQAVELESQLEEAQAISTELEMTSAELQERSVEAEAAATYARGILESIADPFVVYDADWRFRFVNEAAAKAMWGSLTWDVSEYTGKVLWEAFPYLAETKFGVEMRRAASERIPVEFEAFNAHQGSWARISCSPLPDGGLAAQWQSITARKKAEEALQYLDRTTTLLTAPLDMEERLKDLAALVVPHFADWCAVDIVGDNGTLQRLSVAHVDPRKVEFARELERRYPTRLDAPNGVPHVIRTGQAELHAEITDEMLVAGALDEEHLRISRELGLHSAIVVPLVANAGPLGALTLVSAESKRRYDESDLSLAREIARRAAFAVDNARQHQRARKAQLEAEAANKAKSEFLAAMSHELRTPLNAISGYVDLLLVGVHGPLTPEQESDLERVRSAQRHLLGLITDVLSFARIEAGHLELRLKVVHVATLIAELHPFVEPQLAEYGLAFASDEIDPELVVRIDHTKARQILLNLVSNSVKFTPRGGRIAVHCDVTEFRVAVRVTDTGIGIPADKLAEVFEPFVQVHRKLTEPTGGVGLGLAISRDLARSMGGDLVGESAEGAGSTFTFTMPRA
ncbi:MAG: ATP-binding protein [bacterium]